VLNAQCPAALAKVAKGHVIRLSGDEHAFELPIPGQHNQLNAQSAFAAASIMGVSWDEAQRALHEFRALPHRLQLVHEANGVRWINDSIATIPEAAIAALQSFPAGKVIQIVGGYDKHLEMSGMCEALAERTKAVLTIGTLGPKLAEKIGIAKPQADVRQCGELSRPLKSLVKSR